MDNKKIVKDFYEVIVSENMLDKLPVWGNSLRNFSRRH